MRKSFTRLFSIFILFCLLGFQALANVTTLWEAAKSIPKEDNVTDKSVKPGNIATQFVVAFTATPTITATGGTLAVYKDGNIIKTIAVTATSSDVSVVGNTLVVKHGIASFVEKSTYEIRLPSGAVKVGNSDVAITSGEWDFTIGDFTAPKLIASDPLAPVGTGVVANLTINGSTNSMNLTLKFDEAVQKGTGKIAIYKANGTVVELIDVSSLGGPWNDGSVSVPVSPLAHFEENTSYYVKVDAGAFTDINFNSAPSAVLNKFAGINTTTAWTFTTRDNSAPNVTALVSDIDYTSAKLNVSLSEAGTVKWLVATSDPTTTTTGFTTVTGTLAANTTKIIPVSTLIGGTTYYAYVIATNSVSSNPNETSLATAIANRIEFKTIDHTGPVTYGPSATPANGRGRIDTNKQTTGLYIYFDEQVKGGTGNLSVRKASDNTLIYSIPASRVTCSKVTTTGDTWENKYKAVVNFDGSLASKEDYYVVFPEGYIEDMSGNDYVSANNGAGLHYPVPLNYNDWTFTSSDYEAPVVSFYTTTKSTATTTNITGAANTDNIFIKFNEAVTLVDGTSWGSVTDWTKYVALQKDGITVDADYICDGSLLTINPFRSTSTNLQSNTAYSVILRPGVVKDANNNVLAAGKSITVTTGDNEILAATFGPTTLLKENTSLTISFNKAVRAITATSPSVTYAALKDDLAKASIKLEKNEFDGTSTSTTTVAAADYTATYDAVANKITVVPATGKVFATSSEAKVISYKLSVLANKIADNGGNVLGTVSNLYTVSDYKKPVASLLSGDYAGGVTPLTISFDEPVSLIPGVGSPSPSLKDQLTLKLTDAQGANIDFAANMVGNVITVTPTVDFEMGKTYYYGIGASMSDNTGNVNLPVFKSFAVTAVAPAPTVTALTYTVNGGSTSYAIGSTATPATGVVEKTAGGLSFVVNFDRAVSLLNAQTVTTTFTDGLSYINASTVSQVSIDGSKLTITIPGSVVLGSLTDYTVYVPANLVMSNVTYDGTNYAAQPAFSFTVTSKDIVKPQISTLYPSGIDVPLTWGADGLKIKFDEKVASGTGNITIAPVGGTATETTTIPAGSSAVSLDATSQTATITVSPLTKYYTVYTVTIDAGAFKDLAGNTLTGTLSYTFRTIANPQPAVASSGLYPADDSDMVPTSLNLTMTFTESVVKASTIGSRKLVYVIKDDATPGGSYIDNAGDIHVASGDAQVYYAYVDDDSKVVVSGNAVTIKDVTLAADSKYYVLITPGAFKDLSVGNGVASYGSPVADYPVPGVYAGIESDATVWNFQTGDKLAPTVALSFTKLGSDGFPTTDSDIKLTFSKPIVGKVGSNYVDVVNTDIPNIIKLEKLVGSTWTNVEFTGHINANATEITIENSSLVRLNEMVGNTEYTVSFNASTSDAIVDLYGKVSHTLIGTYSSTFTTTDDAKPSAPVVSYSGGEVTAISYDSANGEHKAILNIAAEDVNSGKSDHTAIKVYYMKSASSLGLQASDVKGLADADGKKTLASDGNFEVTFKGSMDSKTTYYVYAVSEDMAGNLSDVTKFSFITDDVVKPLLSGTLPTAFSATKLTFVFNENVKPATGAKARIIDNDNSITYYVNLLSGTASNTIVTDSFTSIDPDVASYTIEVDPAMIVDVPRQVGGSDVNIANAFDGMTGTSCIVTSSDKTRPVLVTPSYASTLTLTDVDVKPIFTATFSEPVTTTTATTTIAIIDSNNNPYDLISASNISGLGTAVITFTPSRTYVSEGTYSFVIPEGMFKDMNGNVWNEGSITVTFTVKDVVPLSATFKAGATALPATSALVSVPALLTIDLHEPFFINPNDANNNTYDLQQHFYLKQGDSNLNFTATVSGTTSIVLSNLNGTGLGDAAKGKTYTFGYTNLYDDAKNVNTGQEASFSVAADAVVPWKVKFTPGDNDNSTVSQVGISVDQLFTVEFNGIIFSYDSDEAKNNLIMSASLLNSLGTFTLSPAPSGSTLNVVSYSEATGKSVVTLKCSKPLDSQINYTLTLNPNKIQIGQGHTALSNYVEMFTTVDIIAPKLAYASGDVDQVPLATSYLPNNGGTVGKDQTLGLVFTEPIVGAGIVEIHRWDGVLVASVDITGKTGTTTSPTTLNIAKISDLMTSANPMLVTNTKYYVIVPAGSVVDKATVPNAFAGITAVNAWSFDLRDDAHPVVTFVDNGKTGIATNADIRLVFDRPVNVNSGFLAIYTETGNVVQLIRIPVAGTVTNVTSYSVDINTLNENTKYLLELGEGSFVLNADNATPQLAIAKGEWWFSTEINSAPVATDFVPANVSPMTSGVLLGSDLKITFDQDVMAGTGNIQLHRKQSSGGPIITNFDVTDPTKVVFNGKTLTIPSTVLGLHENSEYYVIVPSTAVKNTSYTPEYFSGIIVPFAWSFSTVTDATAPTVTVTDPIVPIGKVFTVGLTFSEPVTGVNTNTIVVTNGIASITGSGAQYTLTVTSEEQKVVTIVLPNTITDLATPANAFAGKTLSYTTADLTAPKVVVTTPTGTLTDNYPTLVVTFDENVVFGAGKLNIYKKSDNSLALAVPVTASMVSGKVATVTYTYDATLKNGLDKNTDYYVLADAGLVKDVAGNAFAGITATTTWTFKTGDFATITDPDVNNSLEFKVYPNPFVESVTVSNASELSKVVVSNIAGQVVKEVVYPDGTIQLNELHSGVYFIALYKDGKVVSTVKLLKR